AVSSAAGINENRGDTISVEPMPFNTDLRDQREAEARQEQLRKDRILYTEIAAMILIAALLLGGFLMYRWKKRKERQAELEAKLEAERQAREEEKRVEEIKRREEELQRREEEAQRREEAEERAQAIENHEIEDDNLTPAERQQLTEKEAILKLIDEKPEEVAWLIKTWLIEDE
ncbi:MAG: hypothetical protein J5497_08580, partial [Selenomonadaceae bacterium]|nr:hypothetical protein [Selenomonadaceae bacterium]